MQYFPFKLFKLIYINERKNVCVRIVWIKLSFPPHLFFLHSFNRKKFCFELLCICMHRHILYQSLIRFEFSFLSYASSERGKFLNKPHLKISLELELIKSFIATLFQLYYIAANLYFNFLSSRSFVKSFYLGNREFMISQGLTTLKSLKIEEFWREFR